MSKVLEHLVLSIVRYFCAAQKQKGVADAMIEAHQNAWHMTITNIAHFML